MSAISIEQILNELATIKQEIRELRETVAQYQVLQTAHPHIVKIDGHQGGEPMVRTVQVTVRTIVEQTRLGVTPEELVKNYEPVTLAEIYDALSYYHDHTDEIEQIIAEQRIALDQVIELSKQLAKTKE